MALNFYPCTALIGGGTGALDGKDGADLAVGDAAFVVLSTGVYHYVNIQDSAVENSPYVIRPDANPGTNSWHLVTPQGPMSNVEAARTTVQSIATTSNTEIVIFDSETVDALGEYNASTGVFTAIHPGVYLVSAAILFANTALAEGKSAQVRIYKNAVLNANGFRDEIQASGTFLISSNVSKAIQLVATDTIDVRAFQNHDSAIDLYASKESNYLTINRLI